MIPIIIVSYNNYKYLDNTVKQLRAINEEYLASITIMDNCSTCEKTIEYLKNTPCKVIYNKENKGPWVNSSINSHIYNEMPDEFILTDADLQFNPNLPKNFVEILSELSNKYNCSKIGFALDLSDYDKMFQGPTNVYCIGDKIVTIYEWEIQFWNNKIQNERYDLYTAQIDTTFCLVNKKYDESINFIRIAGDFVAKHLPWYIDNPILTDDEIYTLYKRESTISTTAKFVLPFLANKYGKY